MLRATLYLSLLGASGMRELAQRNLDLAHAEELPVSFAITPLDWLRGDCRGAVLLDLCWSHWRAEDEAEKANATARCWGGEAA